LGWKTLGRRARNLRLFSFSALKIKYKKEAKRKKVEKKSIKKTKKEKNIMEVQKQIVLGVCRFTEI